MGDDSKVIPAAKLMAFSESPAVRLCAARELAKLRDPRTTEWFDYAARNDDRRVRNEGCGRSAEFFYPVRTVAELALRDMGIQFKSDGDLRVEREAREREIIMELEAKILREMNARR
jgi:hypothetical protein